MRVKRPFHEQLSEISPAKRQESDLEIGDHVPLPKKKLVIRPNAPIDNRPSFKPARKDKR